MASSDEEDECTDLLYKDSDYPREADTDCDSENELIYIKTTTRRHTRDASPSPHSLIVSLPRHYAHGQKLERSVSEETDIQEDMKCVLCLQVLLDPVSLSCGHTFCRVCLVRMKRTRPIPTNINDCPMCRKPWGDIPAVNIIIREMLQKAYPQKIAQRKAELSPEEIQALADQGRTNTASQPANNVPEHPMVIFCSVCIVGLIFTVLSLLMLFIAFKGVGGGFVTKPVSQWSADDVMNWISLQGETIQQDCKEFFERERIDGPHLSLMTNETLVGLNITRPFTVESLLVSIDRLKEDEYVHPTSFSEFYAAYPVQTVMLTLAFPNSPRYTFMYLYLFHYYEMYLPIVYPFRSTESTDKEAMVQQDSSWFELFTVMFELLFVPQVAMSIFAYGWVWDHPILCCIVWLHCLTSFVREAVFLFWYCRVLRNDPTLLSGIFGCLIIFSSIWAVLSLVLSVFPVFLLNIVYYLFIGMVVIDIIQAVVLYIALPVFHFIKNAITRVH